MAPLLFLPFMLSIFSISVLSQSLNNPELLLQFKVAITNNNNTLLPDWTPLHPLCNWTGLTCHPSSRSLIALNLSQFNLPGTISPLLANLSSLRSIDLSYNALTGTIPPQLSHLSRLQKLWLHRNQLQGTIPPSLSACRSLYNLALSYNQLHGSIPPELSLLSSLKILYLGANNLTGTIPSSLGNLSALTELELAENDLTGAIPPSLSACRDLYDLRLHFNQLDGSIPPELSLLSSLKILYLALNKLAGTIPSSFQNLSSLVELELSSNDLTGTIPPELGMLSNLQVLYLYTNNLSGTIPSSLGNLSSLTELDLSENNLHGHICISLGNLSKLTYLNLFQNQLSGHIPWEIGTKLSNLQFLSLWGNQLSGSIPSSLGNCSNLTILYLEKNQLSGTVPMELGKLNLLNRLYLQRNQLVGDSSNALAFLTALTNCSYLEQLLVSYNYLTGTLPPSIGQLSSNLYYLTLSNNMISRSIPEQITNLTNLTYLNLGNNLLSGNIPYGVKRFHKLERLYLGGNNLEGSIPSEIGQMQHLGLLNLSHNQLSGKIPDSLGSLQELRRLHLDHNKLSGEIPVSLEGCQKLELLDLSYNKIGGRIPREVVASIKNLQFYLNLSWNSLEGPLPQEISKIIMGQAIDVSGNRLSGVIPYSLGDCTALEHLNLSHNSFEGPIPDSLSGLKNILEMDLSFNNLSGRIPEGGLFPNRTVITLFGGNHGLCGPRNYSLPPCPNQTHRKHSLLKKIVLSVGGTIAFVLCSIIIGMLRRQKLSRQQFRPSNIVFQRLGYPRFSYQDFVIATAGFDESNLLGVGNFGSVYKGILRDGKMVAIKTLNLENEEADKSFTRECKVLGRIRHRNLVKIITAFYFPGLKGLVLQYASNGSLEKRLYPETDDQNACQLGFSECLSIAADVAHGMEYLHHDCPMQLVHCDLKPRNVLLDADMTALVADFGISRLIATNSIDSLSTTTFALRGSIGYIAPEYGLGGNVSIKGDIYSFGILILEMVTRKKPSDGMFVGDMNLQKWVRSAFPDRVADIVDGGLFTDVNENMTDNRCLLSFINVGLLCSSESPRERPSMRDVAKALENLKTSLIGGAVASSLTRTISDLLHSTNVRQPLASDSQSSTI